MPTGGGGVGSIQGHFESRWGNKWKRLEQIGVEKDGGKLVS